MPRATATKTTATKTTRTSAAKKTVLAKTEDGHTIYEASAPRDAFKKGVVVHFPKVRNWLDRGDIISAFGTVVNVSLFDNEVPYLEVKFDDKKLNKVDLGKDVRKFLLEVK
jgi:hypothetical protein